MNEETYRPEYARGRYSYLPFDILLFLAKVFAKNNPTKPNPLLFSCQSLYLDPSFAWRKRFCATNPLDRPLLAAKENNFALLKHSCLPCKNLAQRTDILAAAAANNNQEMMLWLRELVPEIGNPAGGLIPRSSWDQTTFLEVLKHNHLHLLDWLFKEGCPIGYQVLQEVVKRYDLSVVEKIIARVLKNKPVNWVIAHTLNAALINDKLDVFDFYKHKMSKRNSSLCLTAVKHNHLTALNGYATQNEPIFFIGMKSVI